MKQARPGWHLRQSADKRQQHDDLLNLSVLDQYRATIQALDSPAKRSIDDAYACEPRSNLQLAVTERTRSSRPA